MRLSEQQRGLLREMSHQDHTPVPWRGCSRRTFRALADRGLVDLREDDASLTALGHVYAYVTTGAPMTLTAEQTQALQELLREEGETI